MSKSNIFQTLKKYPITEALAKVPEFKGSTGRRRWRRYDRIDIVSPSLCDDAVKYISPRLEQYRGCDIIDINPGACLWSQTLHRFLQPRCHLLLEPENGYYTPFIKPLLDQAGSTYRHSTLLPTHPVRYWNTYDQIFNDTLLPKREALSPDDPALRKPNRTLLVTGNLHRLYAESKTRYGIAFPSCLTLSHMAQASHMNTLFHSYGLVKMLFWVPAETRSTLLPWHIAQRTAYNATNDIRVDIAEVAGVPRTVTDPAKKSWALLDRERMQLTNDISMLRVADAMEKAKLKIPEHRSSKKMRTVQKNRSKIEKMSKILHLPVLQHTHKDLGALEKSLKKLEAETADLAKPATVAEMKTEPIHKEYKDFIDNNGFAPLDIPLGNRFAAYIQHSIRLVQVEIGFVRLSSAMTDDKRVELEKRIKDVQANVHRSMLQKETSEFLLWQKRAQKVLDDLLGCQADPPILGIDRRPFESMVAKEDEFWPRSPNMLLEIDPREDNLATDLTSSSKVSAIMHDLLRVLMWRQGVSVQESLDNLAPDAGTDLLEEAKIVTDPTKGGRLDHRLLKPTNLTRDMLAQIVVAYCEWPFRPSDAEVREASGALEAETEDGGTLDEEDDDVP